MGNAVGVAAFTKLKEKEPYTDRSDHIGKILTNIGKFAVDSAVNDSLSGITGGNQVQKLVQEESRDKPSSFALNNTKLEDLKLVREELQAKLEKIHKDMNYAKQHEMISTRQVQTSESFKKISNEGTNGLDLQKPDAKKVFIRSRL